MASARDETALQFFVLPLTASVTTPVRTARIHQLVVENIRVNFARRPPQSERIIGTLLGSILPDGTGDIRDCFAVPHLESTDSETPRVDVDFHHQMLDAHLSGNPEDVLVGWYSTGPVVNVANAWINAFYASEVEHPIHLTLDTSFTNVAEGTVKAYLGSFGLLPNQALAVQFQQIPVDLSLLVPEKPVDIDDSFGPQLLHWHKFERADKAWIEKFGQLLSTNLEMGYGVEKRTVPFTRMFEMDDQLFAADDRPRAIPSCVTRNLVSHERFFLSWASLQEESIVKGGILADDNSLDKVRQSVCFVLVQREVDRAVVAGAVGNTLVICSNIHAWTNAIADCTLVGSTKVLVYEPETDVTADEIMKFDFVIASYCTLKMDQSILQSVQWNRVILDEVPFLSFNLLVYFTRINFHNLCIFV